MPFITKGAIMRLSILLIAICAILLMAHKDAYSDDFHVIDLNELRIDYKNFKMLNDKARDPLVAPEPPKEGIDVNMNMGLINNYGYLDSSIQSLTVDSQYRSIGLVLHLGVHLTEYLDVGYFHHSAHVLDESQPIMPGFLTEDAVELRIYLYKSKKGTNSVF